MKDEQIIKSAKKLISKYGFKKVSMDEIANDAGVTKKTVYSYFSSKEELLNIIIKQELDKMKKELEKYEKETGDFMDYIKSKLVDANEKGYISVKNVDVMTFLIYKMYIALMFEWSDSYKKLDEQEITDTILQILKSGIALN